MTVSRISQRYLFVVTLVLLLGACMRLLLLSTEPVGLSAEELSNAQLALGIRSGNFSVVYAEVQPAREGVYPALLALITAVTGEGILLWRLPSVWASLLAIAMTYRLMCTIAPEQHTALLTASLMSVAFWPVMMGRVAVHATLMPFFTALILYLMVQAFDAADYEDAAPWFTAGAFALGVAQYVHYSAWALAIIILVYALYRWQLAGRIIRFQVESLFYATILTLVLLLPLLLFSVVAPQARLQTDQGFLQLLWAFPSKYLLSFISLFALGSESVLYHVPHHPVLSIFLSPFFLIGLGASIVRWRHHTGFLAVIVLFVGLLPASLAPTGADVTYMVVLMPAVFILSAVAIPLVLKQLRQSKLLLPITLALFVVIMMTTLYGYFMLWATLPQVARAYNEDIGAIAHFLDTQPDGLPVSVCSLPVDSDDDPFALTNAELLALLTHRERLDVRTFNCTQSLVLAAGGAEQYVIFPRGHYYDFVPGALLNWLASGESVPLNHVDADVIMRIEAREQLADEVGAFITTALTLWPPEEGSREFAELPVEFEGNVTFLGYEVRDPLLESTEMLEIVTYWRLDGPPPPQVTMFAHLLNNPVVVLAQEDTIGVETATLQARDVFVQYNRVRLPKSTEPGLYPVSVGMFFTDSGERLTALQDGEPRANRLFLQRVEYTE